jgi:phage major head subunit gpT-like protein
MLITPAAIAALQVGFSNIFQRAWQTTSVFWPRMATMTQSSTASNVYGAMARLPAMREWLGPRLFANIEGHAYTLNNRTFELSVAVGRDEIEDDQLGWTSAYISEFGRQAAKWPDQLAVEALQNGTVITGPGGASFDGLSFFNAAHTLNPAGVQSNNLAATPLTAANYGVARETMMAYRGEDGQPMGVMPDLLIVPPQLETEARTILNADFIADPGGVAAGVTNIFKGSADLLVVPELANQATTWYLADSSRPMLPLIWQVRRPVQFTNKTNLTDDNVFRQNRFEWGIDGRGAVGYGPWFLMLRATA